MGVDHAMGEAGWLGRTNRRRPGMMLGTRRTDSRADAMPISSRTGRKKLAEVRRAGGLSFLRPTERAR
jgi:hypothetical protein